jgi:hypothetical protein
LRPICRETRQDGGACGQRAIRGTAFCHLHSPDARRRPPNCVICREPRRAEIEAALASGAGPVEVGRRFWLNPDNLRKHRGHLSPAGTEGGKG